MIALRVSSHSQKFKRSYSTKFNDYLSQLVNYEKQGIPKLAGTSAGKHFDLERMRRLLTVLGNPENDFQVVHVAGSKGKGSTSVFLSNILRHNGLKVGLYTSPHLKSIRERISINNSLITDEELENLLQRFGGAIRGVQAQERGSLSHFEVLTALAFRHFADQRLDLAVIETGLGGLTDATNVVPAKNLATAVITSLGLEHLEALGGSIESIAAAKAGILKPGRPLVLARQVYDSAEGVVLRRAAELGCPVVRPHEIFRMQSGGLRLSPAFEEPSSSPLSSSSSSVGREQAIATPGSCEVAEEFLLSLGATREAVDERLRCLPLSAEAEDSLKFRDASSSSATPGAHDAGIDLDSFLRSLDPECVVDFAASSSCVRGSGERLWSRLVGRHQRDNLSNAIATAVVLWRSGWPISAEAIGKGVRTAFLPGRFEVMPLPREGPSFPSDHLSAAAGRCVSPSPDDSSSTDAPSFPSSSAESSLLVLDGAHTGEAAAALAETMDELFRLVTAGGGSLEEGSQWPAAPTIGATGSQKETPTSASGSTPPLVLIVAMAADKPHREVLSALRRLKPAVVLFTSVPISGSFQRTASPGLLAAQWEAAAETEEHREAGSTGSTGSAKKLATFRCRGMIQASLRAALSQARKELGAFPGQRGVVLVTGSLHAVAEAREICGFGLVQQQ